MSLILHILLAVLGEDMSISKLKKMLLDILVQKLCVPSAINHALRGPLSTSPPPPRGQWAVVTSSW